MLRNAGSCASDSGPLSAGPSPSALMRSAAGRLAGLPRAYLAARQIITFLRNFLLARPIGKHGLIDQSAAAAANLCSPIIIISVSEHQLLRICEDTYQKARRIVQQTAKAHRKVPLEQMAVLGCISWLAES